MTNAAPFSPTAGPSAKTVVITGYGAVGPHGAGKEALQKAFAEGVPRLSEVDLSANYHRSTGARLAALVDPACLASLLSPRQARRMSPPSRFAVVAAKLALADAGLEVGQADADVDVATAVATSTSYGPSSYTEELLHQIFLDQPSAASPFLFTEAVANAPAAQIALMAKARGPNLTLTQREAGPLLALAHGARQVALGRADRAIVAAVEEANPLLHAALDRFGVLSGSRPGRPSARHPEIGRPFDLHRDGFVLAEGATAIVVETLDTALERGAAPMARIAAVSTAFDPSAPVAGYGHRAELLAERLRQDFRRQGYDPTNVGLVVSGASGSPTGDALEARVLRSFFSSVDPEAPGQGNAGSGNTDRPPIELPADRGFLPPILVPKATTGEHGGGLLAGAMAAFDPSPWAPTPGFETVDPALGCAPWGGGSPPASDHVLVSAMAVGGSAAWILLERCPHD